METTALQESSPAAIGQQPDDGSGETVSLRWQWPGGMFALCVTNFLLRLVTFGIYHFWAKTETRKRIWSGVRINGEPLTYTGRGMELFLGFLIVSVLVFLPLAGFFLWLITYLGPEDPRVQFAALLVYLPAFILFGFAFYRAQRYQRARTRWRGVRFSLEGSAAKYAWTYVWTTLLLPFTAGWLQPWRLTALQKQVTGNTMFGDRKMHFDADSGPLYPTYAGFWFGVATIYLIGVSAIGGLAVMRKMTGTSVPAGQNVVLIAVIIYGVLIFGGLAYAILSAWFRSKMINHFASHTRFENGNFEGNVRARGLIWISISNFLLRVLSVMVVGGIVGGLVYAFVPMDLLTASGSDLGQSQQQLRGMIALSALVVFIASWSFFGPIVQARTTGYVASCLSFVGTVPLGDIQQANGADVSTGEGMAELFDIDVLG